MDRVTYHRLARRELNEAAQYYESESQGLGAAFLDEVERCTQAIANFPEAGPLITETIRR
ncbi:MAG: type II toxin-antitoxin system RelE/ParE family toxin [Nitrospira sp.]|nr:type II toxin-antitoxin system RelE/ParE family toxin [Nitrospira sp.]